MFGRPRATETSCRNETDPIALSEICDWLANWRSSAMRNGAGVVQASGWLQRQVGSDMDILLYEHAARLAGFRQVVFARLSQVGAGARLPGWLRQVGARLTSTTQR